MTPITPTESSSRGAPDVAMQSAMNICHDLHEGHVPGCSTRLDLKNMQAAREYIASVIRSSPGPTYPSTPLDRALGAAVRIGVDLKILEDSWPDGQPAAPREALFSTAAWIDHLQKLLRAKLAGEGGKAEAAPVLEWKDWYLTGVSGWLADSEVRDSEWNVSLLDDQSRWSVHRTTPVLTGIPNPNCCPTFTTAAAAKSWCESRELALRAKQDGEVSK